MGDRILVQVDGKTRPLTFHGDPVLNSTTTKWAGPALEQHHVRSSDVDATSGPIDGQCGLMIVVEGAAEFLLREGSRDVRRPAQVGSASFLSGSHRPHLLRVKGQAEIVALQISRKWFRRLLLDDTPQELGSTVMFVPDATVLALTCAMRDEVARGASTGRLYAESLTVALLSYAVDRIPLNHLSARGSLPEEQQRRVRNHILDNLGEDLSLTELAGLVGRKPRHFSTLFRRAFGTTPHRYLVEARLAEAARRLGEGHDIAEVAMSLGFCSQSHFTETFRRVYGVTPKRYAVQKRTTSCG